jgi:hypothetical protein
VQDLLTPENLPATLTAFAAIITAIGGGVLWRSRKEPPKAGTQDAALTALAENTKAINSLVAAVQGMAEGLTNQNDHFDANNAMFKALIPAVSGIARDINDIRHDTADSKLHLSVIRDAANRRAP